MLSKLFVGGALFAAWVVGCSGTPRDDFACATGEAQCSCRSDGTCADGLVCNHRNLCLEPEAGSGGDGNGGTSGKGGNAGAAARGGTAGSAGASKGGASSTMGGGAGMGIAPGGIGGSAGSGTGGTDSGHAGEASGSSNADGGLGNMPNQGGSGGMGNVGGTVASECPELTLGEGMAYRDLSALPNTAGYGYRTNALGDEAPDFLVVEFFSSSYDPINDGEAKGTFALGTGPEENFQTCSRCVTVRQDVTGESPAVTYFATAGTLVVEEASNQMNGEPLVAIGDLTLREVTIAADAHSTLVPDGRCYHLASVAVRIPEAWTCHVDYYATGNGCDCGCGARDGDCESSGVDACTTCHCADTESCDAVSSSDNALCN